MRTLRRYVILGALAALVLACLMLSGIVTMPDGDDNLTRLIAGIAGLLVAGGTALEVRDASSTWKMPEPEDPPGYSSATPSKPPLNEAVEKIREAETFSKRAADKVRIRIDVEDTHED
jgi:hypothetical protein